MSRAVVITGASSGIGAALAEQLAARGDRVVLAARRKPLLDALASRLGPNAHAIVADVTSRADVERLRDRSIGALGGIDVWVNNAGRGISKPALELTDAEFDDMMLVNVKSALYGMQAIVPHFVERGGRGHIINVSSFLSRVPVASIRSAYNASKAALNALTANVRMDLARTCSGIHVTLVMPGLVNTDFPTHAVHGTPPLPPAALAGAQTAGDAAAAIVAVIDRPAAEILTNPAQKAAIVSYFEDVAAFEARLRS